MAGNDKIQEFVQLLDGHRKAGEKIQTAWAKVKSVDWDKKTMTATGVSDNLDFNDVLLGLGIIYLKPKQDTMCLIGLIENKEAAAFLIDAAEVEELAVKFDKITADCTDIVFNDGNNGGLVVSQKISDRLNQLETALNQIKSVFGAHTHSIPTGSSGTPSAPLTYTVPNSQADHFENTDIKH